MLKKITFGLFSVMLFLNLSCQKQTDTEPPKDILIQIQAVPENKEIKYYHQAEGYRLEWTTYELEQNQNVVKHLQGDITIEDMQPILAAMIKTVFDTEKNALADKINTLAWGRIVPDNSIKNTEVSKRLVVAAALAREWDRKTGSVKTGQEINTWIKDLANQADIFYEIPQAFEEQGMTIKISSVEKVLVSRADALPYFEKIKKFGIKAEDKLPWDCQVWFDIQR
jgi:hypothetical protein